MPIPAFIRQRPVRTTVALVVGFPLLLFALWTAITLNYSYSNGDRAGYLQKLSQRGWLCKTWEGELQMTALPGAAPETFLFTTRSDSLAAVMNGMLGQRVVLQYEEHRGVPTSCFGDTRYFVVAARPVK